MQIRIWIIAALSCDKFEYSSQRRLLHGFKILSQENLNRRIVLFIKTNVIFIRKSNPILKTILISPYIPFHVLNKKTVFLMP